LKQDVGFEPMQEEHRNGVIDVLNYYIENSFAAYPAYVLKDGGNIIGYGGLRADDPMPVFNKTAEVSYFILPEHTGKGLGRKLLEKLEAEAKQKDILGIVDGISSLNTGSIRFHEANGFALCGTIRKAGCKKDTHFDVVTMQKFI
jgi:L-amino acid N-acyltransferase YncA